jgi:hypothetical protein
MIRACAIALVAAFLAGCTANIAGHPAAGSTTASPATPVVARELSGACPLLSGADLARAVDSKTPVATDERPRLEEASGLVTYTCHYRNEGQVVAFGALSVVFAPGKGGLEASGIEGATRQKIQVEPISGVGDLAATYTERDNDDKRGITATKRLGPDSVVIFLSANTPIPDTVTSRLPDLARAVLTQIV